MDTCGLFFIFNDISMIMEKCLFGNNLRQVKIELPTCIQKNLHCYCKKIYANYIIKEGIEFFSHTDLNEKKKIRII